GAATAAHRGVDLVTGAHRVAAEAVVDRRLGVHLVPGLVDRVTGRAVGGDTGLLDRVGAVAVDADPGCHQVVGAVAGHRRLGPSGLDRGEAAAGLGRAGPVVTVDVEALGGGGAG